MCWLNEASVVSKEVLSDCYQQEANLHACMWRLGLPGSHGFMISLEQGSVTSTHVVTSRTWLQVYSEQCTDHHLLVFLTRTGVVLRNDS